MKILHLYKSFYPETKGGVPYIIQNILSIPDTNVNNEVFVTSEKINDNKSSIHYAHSYGTIFSMPISPMYMIKALKLIRKLK